MVAAKARVSDSAFLDDLFEVFVRSLWRHQLIHSLFGYAVKLVYVDVVNLESLLAQIHILKQNPVRRTIRFGDNDNVLPPSPLCGLFSLLLSYHHTGGPYQ